MYVIYGKVIWMKWTLQWEVYNGEKDFMRDNRVMRDYIQKETKVAGDWKTSEVYDETKTRVVCYMAAATNEWIRVAWRNEIQKS